MRQNNQYTTLYNERKNRFYQNERFHIPRSEAAVREVQRKNKKLVLPILKHKRRAALAHFRHSPQSAKSKAFGPSTNFYIGRCEACGGKHEFRH